MTVFKKNREVQKLYNPALPKIKYLIFFVNKTNFDDVSQKWQNSKYVFRNFLKIARSLYRSPKLFSFFFKLPVASALVLKLSKIS